MCVSDHHCPFLNRSDVRCSQYFHLTELQHAFEHCFDAYQACPVYLERLVERRVRQIDARHPGQASEVVHDRDDDASLPPQRPAFVPLTITPRRPQQRIAA